MHNAVLLLGQLHKGVVIRQQPTIQGFLHTAHSLSAVMPACMPSWYAVDKLSCHGIQWTCSRVMAYSGQAQACMHEGQVQHGAAWRLQQFLAALQDTQCVIRSVSMRQMQYAADPQT